VVILKVGPDEKEYHIHKALLMHHSEHFRESLKRPWMEAEEGVVMLEYVEPAVGKVTHRCR
jgi:hypothetical protein